MNLDLFALGEKAQRFLGPVAIEELTDSPWNPRKTRDPKRVTELSDHIKKAGYDVTRAVKVHRVDGRLCVFAGATRLLASHQAGLVDIPAFEFVGYSDDEIWRFAYDDNAADGQHAAILITDVWADYAVRYAAGMTQQKIADALGVSKSLVNMRIAANSLTGKTKKACSDGTLDEGHIFEVLGVVQTSEQLAPWLSTEQAQSELLAEVLGKHRGSTAGIKPTVKVVREAAGKWKAAIKTAVDGYASLNDVPVWQGHFVKLLIEAQARAEQEVSRCYTATLKAKNDAARAELDQKRKAADDEQRQVEEAERAQAIVSKVVCGDARAAIKDAPDGFKLLLTDPPYGMNFQSGRRTTTAQKSAITGDDESALALFADVAKSAYAKMADNSTALVFVGWQQEPMFRQALVDAGFTVKGSLVWVKNNHGTGDLKGTFAPKHERIIHAVKGSPELRGSRHPDVLSGKDKQDSEHPTEKPQDLLRLLISATTDDADCVVDPFAGSGSALFAAYATGRDFFGIEIDQVWHRSIADRLFSLATEGKAA